MAGKRAKVAPVARHTLAVHRPTPSAEPGLAEHGPPGRAQPSLDPQPQQRERAHARDAHTRTPVEPRCAESAAEFELEARQGGRLGFVRRRDQAAERGGAQSEGGGGFTQGG